MNIKVKIQKPLYAADGRAKVYIWDKYINQAIKEKKWLEVEIPDGSATIDPKEWKEGGDRMEKVFKFPDNPMILYGGYVSVNKSEL